MAVIRFPIWESKLIRIPARGRKTLDFSLSYQLGGLSRIELYKGRCVLPSKSYGEFEIILNDIMSTIFEQSSIDQQGDSGFVEFPFYPIKFFLSAQGESEMIFIPNYDWTYKERDDIFLIEHNSIIPLRKDKIMELDYRQMATFTIWSENVHTHSVVYGDTITLGSDVKCGNGFIDLRKFPYHERLVFNGITTQEYRVVKSCCRYCLHYVNQLGGWDSILMNGKNIKSESYDRKNIVDFQYLPRPMNKERVYQVGVKEEWELNRIMMTDGEGLNVNQIAGSTNLILEDLEAEGSNRYIEVIADDNSVEMKDYSTNGNQFVSLTMKVHSAYLKERR